MRILYYCNEYPPYQNGGIGTVVKIVAEAMVQRGHFVVVAGKYDNSVIKEKKQVEFVNGVMLIRFFKPSYHTFKIRFKNIIAAIASLLRLKDIQKQVLDEKARLLYYRTQDLLEQTIKHYRIDLMEVPDYENAFFHDIAMPVHHRRFSVPVIMRVHGSVSFLSYYFQNRVDNLKETIDKEYFSSVDGICAVSEFAKQYVQEHLTPPKEINVIYNPIENEWLENVEGKGDGKTILFFGKIIESKGTFSVVKAFNIVAEKYPNVRLKLIGNGNIEKAKELLAPQYRNRVEMPGFMRKEEIKQEIDNAMFCVLPSYFENFSMAALEVLARKRALIYTRRSSGSELIQDGENGFLVDPSNIDEIVQKIEQLIDNPKLCQSMAEKGYLCCKERFSVNTIVPQLEQYYQKYVS